MPDLLNPIVLNYVPYAVGLILALVGLFIVRIVLRSVVNKKVRSIKDTPAMSMMDIDQMRKKGLLSEQEYRAVRHSLAENEMDKDRRRRQAERERVLLAQVEKDPEAARLLLDLGAPTPPSAPLGARTPSSAPPPAPPPTPANTPAPAPASHPGDLDLLLQKGAITPEEYQRLKSFFQ